MCLIFQGFLTEGRAFCSANVTDAGKRKNKSCRFRNNYRSFVYRGCIVESGYIFKTAMVLIQR